MVVIMKMGKHKEENYQFSCNLNLSRKQILSPNDQESMVWNSALLDIFSFSNSF